MNNAVVVVDASVLVDVLLEPERRQQLAEMIGERAVAAPAHIQAEVASALARLFRGGNLTADQVSVRLASVQAMPVKHHPVGPLLAEAWKLRDNVAILDALYVALAQKLDTEVITSDGRLTRAHPCARLASWTHLQ